MEKDFWTEDFLGEDPIEITEEIINLACSRVEAFALVNKARSLEEKKEAIATMIGALGLNKEGLKIITDRIRKITPAGEVGTALLGLLIGLYISEELSKKDIQCT